MCVCVCVCSTNHTDVGVKASEDAAPAELHTSGLDPQGNHSS